MIFQKLPFIYFFQKFYWIFFQKIMKQKSAYSYRRPQREKGKNLEKKVHVVYGQPFIVSNTMSCRSNRRYFTTTRTSTNHSLPPLKLKTFRGFMVVHKTATRIICHHNVVLVEAHYARDHLEMQINSYHSFIFKSGDSTQVTF